MHHLLWALLFDAADFLPMMSTPITGDILEVLAFFKRFYVSAPIELIPGLDMLPTYTVAVVAQRLLTGAWTWGGAKAKA